MKKIERIDGRIFLVAEIDSSKSLTEKGLYNEFSYAFNFPPTQSKNYYAVLHDFMTDLGWLTEKNFKIRVTNLKKTEKNTDGKQVN